MSIDNRKNSGNGKRDRTPSPVGLRKIKRISFNVFLDFKELFKSFKRRDVIKRRYRNKPRATYKRAEAIAQSCKISAYDPSNIDTAYDSLYWRWHRVAEWHRYINDTIENIKGHQTMI